MITISPTIKGLITGTAMILFSVWIYSSRGSFENNLQYITYAIYVAGVIWTLVAYSRMEVLKTFGTYFSQGFKCFIVVTLMMVAFTIGFLKMNPGMREEMAQNFRAELLSRGNKTPPEVESMVLQAKENYTTMLTSVTIFSYLLIGSVVTLITTGLLIVLRPKPAPHRIL